MKNPLNKRILREFRQDIGKYLVIFLFLVLLIGLVSGFLVTDNSFEHLYYEGFTEKNLEDGHFSFSSALPENLISLLESQGDITIHELFYFEEKLQDTEKTIRVYSSERDVNVFDLMEGEVPSSDNEIALDRMFADNNDIQVGDTIILRDTELLVSGLIASPDYSCLFEDNSDMMFDSINFSIAVMSPEGMEHFQSSHFTYNYAWLYPETIERTDKAAAKERSDELIQTLKEVFTVYSLGSLLPGNDNALLELTDYLPRYLNQAINFTGDDMGSDRAMTLMLDYIITLVLAFVFAITISGTITAESGVIGTLRSSGYTRKELISHYMILPMVVSLIAAIIGNILGYTVFSAFFIDIYYGSFSFPPYHALVNADAFILTTVIPLIMMAVINFVVLSWKLHLSPLRFLRHDLRRRTRKKALKLNTKIPFIQRFRIRILLQNIPNYLTLFLGIFIGGVLVVFGSMFVPLLNDYKELIINDRISDYQYILYEETETTDPQAEKYLASSLNTTDTRYLEDEITIYGIWEDSSYVDIDFSENQTVVSSSIAEKFQLSEGDTIVLRDPYDTSELYTFTIGGIYTYTSGLAIFLPRSCYIEVFEEAEDAYTGYFSNEELTDIDDASIAAVITVEDLTKVSDQLTVSMGEMMVIFEYAGAILFALLMYLMSKQILEKNAASISMTKILGFTDTEISKLYIIATSVIVVASLLISIPLIDAMLRVIFSSYMYTEMTGYLPYIVSSSCYVKLFVIGILCYLLISLLQMHKIKRIPKSDALKNME